MGKSITFVRKLIEAERYKDYKKDYWGGADVVIVSPVEDVKDKEKVELIDNCQKWYNESTNTRTLVKTKHASSVIWLIETLKPYINCDYLSKYEYYAEIADFVIKHENESNKELLNNLLRQLSRPFKERQHSWFKSTQSEIKDAKVLDAKESDKQFNWQNWYNYGIEHNNPFFVKFMALWIAFNEKYKNYPQYNKYGNYDERLTIENFCEQNKKVLSDKFEDVFIKSKLTEEFYKMNDEKEFYVRDMKIYEYPEDKREKIIKYRKMDSKNVTPPIIDKWKATKAMFSLMYSVRCNLFHGGKDAMNERDIELVRCSGEILEIYLKDLM